MIKYQENDILRIAKRIRNNKRPYLLVNPLQAKHIPVSPSGALQMMEALGHLVAEKFGEARLVIGFAETATAIGAVVAKTISDECMYMHTTRESVQGAGDYVFFNEEHSHATEQKLVADRLERCFPETETIVLVDDEFSTGKTLINMVSCLRARCPAAKNKKIVAASIINRLSEENLRQWRDEGIESICLLKLENTDYSSAVETVAVSPAPSCPNESGRRESEAELYRLSLPDPRAGVVISEYYDACIKGFDLLRKRRSFRGKHVLVLGTEECMLPALLIGKLIEDTEEAKSVKCHATTRSPIGISGAPGYPIASGYRIPSFYDQQRETYIYNLSSYDTALIISDAKGADHQGLKEISGILKNFGCKEILCLAGDDFV